MNFQLPPNFFGPSSTYKEDLLQEIYILTHHGGFSYSDILIMPVYERKKFVDMLITEAQKIKDNRERESNKPTN